MEQVIIKRVPGSRNDGLVEYRITCGDRKWSGWYAEDAESYYSYNPDILHENTLTAFKKRIRIEIGKLTN